MWRQYVGATTLLTLDTNVSENDAAARAITDRLYSGDRRHRLEQELVLGVGGVRALRALGIDPLVFHLNEGHACFLLLELLAEQVEAGSSLPDAVATVRGEMSPEDEDAFKAPIRAQYEQQGNPYYSTARLWDDGMIDPADTRTVLGLALSVCAGVPVEPVSYGVFRM